MMEPGLPGTSHKRLCLDQVSHGSTVCSQMKWGLNEREQRPEGNFGKKMLDMQRCDLKHCVLETIHNLLSGSVGFADKDLLG